ncbi:hypothetical protein BD309DRAFT_635305 [Dichomitus squalens]|nr:hypothetical protein BD309DRAFT_635305 [Dichomitus squalens]
MPLSQASASLLFGNFKGLPPLLIQAGEAEVLRDEITFLTHKASLAGVEARYELYEDMGSRHNCGTFTLVPSTRHFCSV